jgi:hypothetical protein
MIALGCAAPASQADTRNGMRFSPDGIGQALLWPYYTTGGGSQTLMTLVNNDQTARAVRLRFRESHNGRSVLELNLYLSPFDMWTAAIAEDPTTGGARLVTSDTTCTLPAVPTGGLAFRRDDYVDLSASGGANRQDHPDTLIPALSTLARTREGSIELIDMGALQTGSGLTRLAEEVTHIRPASPGTVVARPSNCAALVASWTPGRGGWADQGAATGMATGTPRYAGSAMIVDVANGTMVEYSADAIDGFHTNAAAIGALHAPPTAAGPDLGDCDHGGGRCTVLVYDAGAGREHALVFDRGGGSGWDAAIALFMADSVANEFVTEAGIAAQSEWVVHFPGKEYYVSQSLPARPPYVDRFDDDGASCSAMLPDVRTRDGLRIPLQPFAADPNPPITVCRQTQVLTWNQFLGQTSAVLGSAVARNISTTDAAIRVVGPGGTNNPAAAPQYANGRATLRFVQAGGFDGRPSIQVSALSDDGSTSRDGRLYGLPVSGFWAMRAVNAAAQPGLLATYGGAYRHTVRRLTSGI